jgi:hypothetical protein
MSGYYVTKRPGQKAQVIENEGPTIGYETIKAAVDRACFTMTCIQVGDKLLDVFCDDEGLLKELPVCFWHARQQQPIVGPVIVCDHDQEGESTPLTKDVAEAAARWLDANGPVRN